MHSGLPCIEKGIKLSVSAQITFEYFIVITQLIIIILQVVVIDGTFLTGKYKGTLLGAVAQDANRNIFPLAFAIADTENNSSWEWFLRQLRKVVPPSNDLVFVSDRHVSISRAIGLVYPSAHHCICRWHMEQNIRSTFKKRYLGNWFKKAADSYSTGEFDKYFDRIKESCPKMATYLVSAGVHRWARAHSPITRYNMMTSNNAESINAIFKGKKNYPIVALLNFAREKLGAWFQERREKASKHEDKLTPAILDLIRNLQDQAREYKVQRLDEYKFEVKGQGSHAIVDLSAKTCTCKFFDIEKIPCVHALSAIMKIKANVSDFVARFYTTDAWKLAYAETIYPVLTDDESGVPEAIRSIKCYPPVVKRGPGRPPSNRLLPKCELKRRLKYSRK